MPMAIPDQPIFFLLGEGRARRFPGGRTPILFPSNACQIFLSFPPPEPVTHSRLTLLGTQLAITYFNIAVEQVTAPFIL